MSNEWRVIVKKCYVYDIPTVRRPLGQPRIRLKDQVQENLQQLQVWENWDVGGNVEGLGMGKWTMPINIIFIEFWDTIIMSKGDKRSINRIN